MARTLTVQHLFRFQAANCGFDPSRRVWSQGFAAGANRLAPLIRGSEHQGFFGRASKVGLSDIGISEVLAASMPRSVPTFTIAPKWAARVMHRQRWHFSGIPTLLPLTESALWHDMILL